MSRPEATRERKARGLAEKLFFVLTKDDSGYSLSRKVGEFEPQHGLTLDEVERILELWKLQGPHGG
jgi:hypothetical protein